MDAEMEKGGPRIATYVVRVPPQGDTCRQLRMQNPERGPTFGLLALMETDQLPSRLKSEGATTAFVQNMCSSSSVATNSSPLRWKALAASERTGGLHPKKKGARNEHFFR